MATIRLHPDFREFLKLLNSGRVEYLLIGGLKDLLRNKAASGRHKDVDDLEHLRLGRSHRSRE